MTGKPKLSRWAYGYIRPNAKGQGVYVIDKRIGGIHFHISTRRTSEHAAIREYERFELDPHGYHPGAQGADALRITPELTDEFGVWMRDVKRDSREWIRSVIRFLGDWSEALGRKDLRSLNVQRDLKPPLKKWRSQRQRVEAIKSFCTWLRTEKGLLSKGNDATQDFRIPPASAEKLRRRKVVSEEDIRRVLPLLPDETRDVLVLQLGTAWHISECRRFAFSGEILPLVGGKMLAALTVKHKSGELVSQPVVAQEHLEAARRIKARGRIPLNETLARNMRDACDRVRAQQALMGQELMPHWRLGQMRHTVLTLAVERGATPEQAAQFAHHRSPTTTKRFYLDLAVPVVSVPVLRLVKGDGEKVG